MPDLGAAGADPVDIIEAIAANRGWSHDREIPETINAELDGRWGMISLYAAWDGRSSTIMLVATCALPLGTQSRGPLLELVAILNQSLGIGHVCLYPEEGMLCFRHATPLRGAVASSEMLEDVLDAAVLALDNCYPAFQYVVWGGQSPADAAAAALMQTRGEA